MIVDLPAELFEKIFNNLKECEIRQCLLVNKSWSKATRRVIENTIHLTLTEKTALYKDLVQFPLLATRVTRLTINTDDTLYCILILSLCPNVLNLMFDKCIPEKLLDCLVESEFALSPKIQEISAGSPHDFGKRTSILWPCIYKHRVTITKISAYWGDKFTENIPQFIANFPQLEVLDLAAVSIVNLHSLLLHGRNLRSISLSQASVYYDNKDDPEPNFSTNLQEITICSSAHISVLNFLVGISGTNFEASGGVTVIKDQDKELLDDILENFPHMNHDFVSTQSSKSGRLFAFTWKNS